MKAETSRNILLIALAVRLQRLVKNLPNHHISAERISRKSLAEEYFSDEVSRSEGGARKKASRYMDEIDKVFGLRGTESTGYVMDMKFESFREMFEHWLEKVSPPEKSDKRLHVMIEGLLYAINNAFSEDPIVVPNLAKQLKERYKNKNIRDTKEPLTELFEHTHITSLLQLTEFDDDVMGINTLNDPLLLRLKPRSEVGDNSDISINLARPGRIHVIFDHVLKNENIETQNKVKNIAEAVSSSYMWKLKNCTYLPYLLFREGEQGKIMLTMRNLDKHHFEDIDINELTTIPKSAGNYIPFDTDEKTWESFKQLVR